MPNCSKCGRALTHPLSIAAGMGPECAGVGRWPSITKSKGHGEQLGMFPDEELPGPEEEGMTEVYETPRDEAGLPTKAPGPQ